MKLSLKVDQNMKREIEQLKRKYLVSQREMSKY